MFKTNFAVMSCEEVLQLIQQQSSQEQIYHRYVNGRRLRTSGIEIGGNVARITYEDHSPQKMCSIVDITNTEELERFSSEEHAERLSQCANCNHSFTIGRMVDIFVSYPNEFRGWYPARIRRICEDSGQLCCQFFPHPDNKKKVEIYWVNGNDPNEIVEHHTHQFRYNGYTADYDRYCFAEYVEGQSDSTLEILKKDCEYRIRIEKQKNQSVGFNVDGMEPFSADIFCDEAESEWRQHSNQQDATREIVTNDLDESASSSVSEMQQHANQSDLLENAVTVESADSTSSDDDAPIASRFPNYNVLLSNHQTSLSSQRQLRNHNRNDQRNESSRSRKRKRERQPLQAIHSNLPTKRRKISKSRSRSSSTSSNTDRPFVCPKCQKDFKESGHLNRHYRESHTYEKPFPCPECSQSFKDSKGCVEHVKRHHNIPRFKAGIDRNRDRSFKVQDGRIVILRPDMIK